MGAITGRCGAALHARRFACSALHLLCMLGFASALHARRIVIFGNLRTILVSYQTEGAGCVV
jgi:hypothetical protein